MEKLDHVHTVDTYCGKIRLYLNYFNDECSFFRIYANAWIGFVAIDIYLST